MDNGSYSINEAHARGMRYPYFAGYFQDDFKMRAELHRKHWTEVGLYTEHDRGEQCIHRHGSDSSESRCGRSAWAAIALRTAMIGNLSSMAISYNNWGPRLGFAWQPMKKLVVRSGLMASATTRPAAQGGGNANLQGCGFTGESHVLLRRRRD